MHESSQLIGNQLSCQLTIFLASKARSKILIIKAISLFSGIGAFELAGSLVFGETYQTFQFVEIDLNAQHILLSKLNP